MRRKQKASGFRGLVVLSGVSLLVGGVFVIPPPARAEGQFRGRPPPGPRRDRSRPLDTGAARVPAIGLVTVTGVTTAGITLGATITDGAPSPVRSGWESMPPPGPSNRRPWLSRERPTTTRAGFTTHHRAAVMSWSPPRRAQSYTPFQPTPQWSMQEPPSTSTSTVPIM